MAHNHSHDHGHIQVSGKKLIWTILFNLMITAAEFIGGFLSGYLALIADAVHNLSDVASLGLAWLGVKGSAMPSTKKSTYGYKRIEVMTALISAVSLIVIALYILREAYDRFISPQELTHPTLFITVAVIGLLGNVVSIFILQGEKGKSLNMKAAFLHMAYDAVSSLAVIIGGIIILLTGIYLIDVFLSVIIALMIFWSSYQVIKEALLIFLEAVPQGIDFDHVYNSIAANETVTEVHDLHIWSLSSSETAMSCHIVLCEDDMSKGPEIIAQINRILLDKYHIGHCTIQVDSVACHTSDILCGSDLTSENE